jgi:hypothetical protein
VLLSFLKIRVVVNDKEIYPLISEEPVIIALDKDFPRIVITDGFHFTPPVKLEYKQPGYFNFKIGCILNDIQLSIAGILLIILYLLGFSTGFFFIKILSFAPLLLVIFFYYFNRKKFLQITQVKNG